MMKRLILVISLCLILSKVEAQNCNSTLFPNGQQYYDTYHEVASNLTNWKHFNTHDPTVFKQGEWFYMYSTDASWAGLNKKGAMKRRSKDLVNWEYMGNAFNGIPQSAVDFFKINNPSYTDQGIWAPFLFQFKNKYFLYYSGPGGLNNVNYAFLGWASSDSLNGPWTDHGIITSSYKTTINAIDPTVVYDSTTHKLWMAYGSWFTGIYALELDTLTGGLKTPGDLGKVICNRSSTGKGQEGPELAYRNGWYYLFVSYDGLGDLYNVRVGRSRTPDGPYYDFAGKNMAGKTDNIPMIQAPYKFNNHPGWQGTGHCGVYNDNGKYYMFNQGRPTIEPAMMVLHVREIFWIDDWPVVSPERYAGVPNCAISKDSIIGKWEHMPLTYHTALSNLHCTSVELVITADGNFNASNSNTWTYVNDTLILKWNGGTEIHKLIVRHGWDWENNCKTITYTGINDKGICAWGKKINPKQVEKYNTIIDGATYQIKNGLSHLYMNVPNGLDVTGSLVKQEIENKQPSQLWKVKNAGDGHYYLLPRHSKTNLCLEVRNGTATNGNNIIVAKMNGLNRQKFNVVSNANGYYRILTKVGNGASCIDDEGLSTNPGSNMIQWAYLKGLNQQWQFIKMDSIAIDPISIDTFPVELIEGIKPINKSAVYIYPNPSKDGKISIDCSSFSENNSVAIVVTDLKGSVVYKYEIAKPTIVNIDLALPKGIYLIRINSNSEKRINKLVIQ